jgi:hypothetical protein
MMRWLLLVAGCLASCGPRSDADPAVWRPAPGTSWQWQLSGTIDDSLDVAMYDVDLFDAPAAVIDRLHARRIKVICYFSAGSYEPWRPDAARFPPGVVGAPVDGWPRERWLDIRTRAVRARMIARLDRARERGCDGVEPDNVDGYANRSGFPLTARDQLRFNRYLARQAHARGLSIGLKNDLEQAAALEPWFDWALDEECMRYDECDLLTPFVAAGKAVFHVEYGDAELARKICPQAHVRKFDTLVKTLALDRVRIACR